MISTVARVRAGQSRDRDSVSSRDKVFSEKRPYHLWGPYALLQMGTGHSYPGCKAAGT